MNNQEFAEYLAGFIDGDGSIYVSNSKSSCSLCIGICQNIINFIEYINNFFEGKGKIYEDKRKERIAYTIRFCGENTRPILELIKDCLIIKKPQCDLALQFLSLTDYYPKFEVGQKIKELNKNKNEYSKNYNLLTKNYLAGLFDAEGCITMKSDFSLRTKLTQKSDIQILHEINKRYNNKTKLDNYACIFWGEKCESFLKEIYPKSIIKKEQIKIALDYIDDIKERKTNKKFNLDKREGYKQKLIQLKSNNLIKLPDNQEEKIKTILQDLNNYSYNDLLFSKKLKEIEETPINRRIEDLIYLPNTVKLKIQLEVCSTKTQFGVYNYLKTKTSSLPSTNPVGRCIKILVKDTLSGKYLGLLCLSSPVFSMGKRDTIFTNKSVQLKNTMDISCCVPLQPFGYNFCGGKLLAMLCFSKEVSQIFKDKYGDDLLCLVTTSINGKSVQYSGIDKLKYIGNTLGNGSVHIPVEVVEILKNYNTKENIVQGSNRVDLFSFINTFTSKLGTEQITSHYNPRGIYYGFVYQDFNSVPDINKLQSIGNIYNTWLTKFAQKRYTNLTKNDKFKTSIDLYTIESIKEKDFKLYKLPVEIDNQVEKVKEPKTTTTNEKTSESSFKSKLEQITEEHWEIIRKSQGVYTSEKTREILKEAGTILPRTLISRIWNKNLSEEELSYLPEDLPTLSVKRNYSRRKFTEEQDNFIQSLKEQTQENCKKAREIFIQEYPELSITKECITKKWKPN